MWVDQRSREVQIPRRVKPARDDKFKGLVMAPAEAAPP